jgi:hypothetical protein
MATRNATLKKPLLVLLTVALLLLGAMLPLVLPRHCPVNRAAYERIEKEMTRAEVEAILGGPPGDYRTRPGFDVEGLLHPGRAPWFGDDGFIMVIFRPGGGVQETKFFDVGHGSYGLVDFLWWRLRHLKEQLLR